MTAAAVLSRHCDVGAFTTRAGARNALVGYALALYAATKAVRRDRDETAVRLAAEARAAASEETVAREITTSES
ncbi:MAG: hypothetical protein ACRDSH_20410 [Pseudonocardiaceae bacterium]